MKKVAGECRIDQSFTIFGTGNYFYSLTSDEKAKLKKVVAEKQKNVSFSSKTLLSLSRIGLGLVERKELF